MNISKLTKHFSLSEFLRSQVAERNDIDMTPSGEVVDNLLWLCSHILQPIRESLGPVHITSGFRPLKLNRLLGSSDRSQHITGQAADFVVSGMTPYEVCKKIESSLLPFDQCIHEFGRWVHISFAPPGQEPRKQLLTACRENGRTVYKPGIHKIKD